MGGNLQTLYDPAGKVQKGGPVLPGWIPIKCPPEAKERCVEDCNKDGFNGACAEKTQCYIVPDSQMGLVTPFQAICECRMRPCDYFLMWCKWGVSHGHDRGGWCRHPRTCDDCYKKCSSKGGTWNFGRCPLAGIGESEANKDYNDCIEVDKDIS